MSERASFTTEYIHDANDYKTIRKALDKKDKYLCISPPATWSNGAVDFEMPIVSGKVGELALNTEWLTISDTLYGVKTTNPIRLVVMCDGGAIILLEKDCDGRLTTKPLIASEEL